MARERTTLDEHVLDGDVLNFPLVRPMIGSCDGGGGCGDDDDDDNDDDYDDMVAVVTELREEMRTV